jgi:hypothetical protein
VDFFFLDEFPTATRYNPEPTVAALRFEKIRIMITERVSEESPFCEDLHGSP